MTHSHSNTGGREERVDTLPTEHYQSKGGNGYDDSPVAQVDSVPTEHYQPKGSDGNGASAFVSEGTTGHGVPEYVGEQPSNIVQQGFADQRQSIWTGRRWFKYMKTKDFWVVLAFGQALSICITATNTFTTLLDEEGASIPAFQTLLNYVLLTLTYGTYTVYRYGFKGWLKLIWRDGWRYFILGFMDVEGNFFTVLAYEYTNILSAELINFWAIVVVVIISFIVLHVRYHLTQYLGIILCIGGTGLLIASDKITGASNGPAPDMVKGDLFALLGASFYGLSNVYEEWFVSKRPMYEVIGQLGFWGLIINAVQMAIFARDQLKDAVWNGSVGGYLTGYTLVLFLFYTGAPILFRMSSAAFFNLSLLTGSFWGVIIGLRVFGYHVHYLYPIAFVLIIIGHVLYFMTESILGDAKKPWLGVNQERGVAGIGTARAAIERGTSSAVATLWRRSNRHDASDEA